MPKLIARFAMPCPKTYSGLREPDPVRRRWLAVTSAAGGIGAVAAAVPFVASMAPSERVRALGAPVEVDVGSIKPGGLLTVEWRGKPVWVLHRTPAMLDALRGHDGLLSDPRSDRREQQPDYARNEWRSIRPDFAVLVAICTHLGCVPTFRPDPGAADSDVSWPGGFFCPCHGSKFDLAGRVFKNVPAPSNLEVPPHRYLNDSRLLVGEDSVT
jgi:ubiquinol-cytochrome c reductase iron-sulfur subunit